MINVWIKSMNFMDWIFKVEIAQRVQFLFWPSSLFLLTGARNSGLPSTVYRLPSTVYRLPSTVYRLPSTVYRLPGIKFCQ